MISYSDVIEKFTKINQKLTDMGMITNRDFRTN